MHESLEDGNVAEEANNIFEDTDGNGSGVIDVSLDEVDEVGFSCEFLRVATIDEEGTCTFCDLENKGTFNKVDETDGAFDSDRNDEGDDEGKGKGEYEGEGEDDDDGDGKGAGEGGGEDEDEGGVKVR